jgi:hypothetical protein
LEFSEAVPVEDDVGGAGSGCGEVTEPARIELQGKIQRLGAATAAGAFGFIGDVFGAALDAGFGLFVEELAGGLFRFFAY